MSEESKIKKGADKTGKTVGDGVRKGFIAVKSFGKGVKKGVKRDEEEKK